MADHKIPARKDVSAENKWNLSSIYKSDEEWEENLKLIPQYTKEVAAFKGKLGSNPETLLQALKAIEKANLQIETVYHYASLKHEADEDDTKASDAYGRALMAYTNMEAELSFVDPELQEIEDSKIREWIAKP